MNDVNCFQNVALWLSSRWEMWGIVEILYDDLLQSLYRLLITAKMNHTKRDQEHEKGSMKKQSCRE